MSALSSADWTPYVNNGTGLKILAEYPDIGPAVTAETTDHSTIRLHDRVGFEILVSPNHGVSEANESP